MGNKTQLVTIPLDEYRTLLLKEKPNDSLSMIANSILQKLPEFIEYEENDRPYYTDYIGYHLRANNGDVFVKEIVFMLKYGDPDSYMDLWNGVMTRERNRKATEEMISQMNEAKSIKAEIKNIKAGDQE